MKVIFIFVVLIFVISSTGYTQLGIDWEWQHPSPHGMTIQNVRRVAPSIWYFVGLNGLFQKTTNDGQTWDYHFTAGRYIPESDLYTHLYDLHFFDLNNGIAVGSRGSIRKTTDAGNTWQEASGTNPVSINITLYALQFVDNLIGFASGSNGTLIKTTDGGNNWSLIPLSFTTTAFNVWSPDGVLIIVPTTLGNIHRSTNGGATWSVINLGSSFNVTKLAGTVNNLYLTGSAGNVRKSTNGGVSWTSIANGIPANYGFNDIDVENGVIYLTGPILNFFKSTNQGVSWDSVSLVNPELPFLAVHHSMAVSPGGDSLFVTSTFGNLYSKLGNSAPVTFYLRQSINSNATDMYVSPNGQLILTVNNYASTVQKNFNRSTDGGLTWTAGLIAPSSTENLYAIDMVDSLYGFTTGSAKLLHRTTDGGLNWNQVTTTGLPQGASFYYLDFVSHTTGWLFAVQQGTPQGTVFKTTDGGTNWVNQPLGVQGVEPG